ncbi:acyl-CoA/acyl-ACP dehydrogenase [Nocardioides sp. JQ2195]|uniref:acyl-CoA dehydrogenase family protein n=1 Tax=Nocardioides sp. JQ2195 TaxID=2592334 RepID=UPI00143EE916|nr:acyl-CoA dehydrogenase family protein [Nocardioides sp. JQ2195]QIX25305.1 acyl-CoA/acyl-ACP dehydrogenase [Nocardioides sp. JQ2195]
MNTIDPDLLQVMRDVVRSRGLIDRLDQGVDGIRLEGAQWHQLQELGLATLTLPEEHGGSGASWLESAALLREAAAAAAHLPLVETDLLAAWLLREADLPVDDRPRTVAVLDESGHSPLVPWAGEVERIVVLAHADGRRVVADLDPSDVDIEPVASRSGLPRSSVRVTGTVDGTPVDDGTETQILLRGALGRAVQSVGAMERIVELCVEHTTVRVQFGRPLCKFQSVQNLVSDIAAETALARSAVDAAVTDAAITDLAGPSSAFRVAVARSCVGHASSTVIRNAHQVHGAIGTTVEHPLQLLTLPLLDWRNEFGGVRFWDRLLGSTLRATSGSVWELATGATSAEFDKVLMEASR